MILLSFTTSPWAQSVRDCIFSELFLHSSFNLLVSSFVVFWSLESVNYNAILLEYGSYIKILFISQFNDILMLIRIRQHLMLWDLFALNIQLTAIHQFSSAFLACNFYRRPDLMFSICKFSQLLYLSPTLMMVPFNAQIRYLLVHAVNEKTSRHISSAAQMIGRDVGRSS